MDPKVTMDQEEIAIDMTSFGEIDRSAPSGNANRIPDDVWLLVFGHPRGPEEEAAQEATLFELKELSCQGKPITDEQLKMVLAHCPGLQALNLRGCTKLTDDTLFTLMYPPGISIKGLRGLAAPDPLQRSCGSVELLCPQLKKIDLRDCLQFDPEVMTGFLACRGGVFITLPPQESCCCKTWKLVLLPLISAVISGGGTALGYYLASRK